MFHSTDGNHVDFVAYQLKDMTYQWSKEYDQSRGDDDEFALWDDFSSAFPDLFFPQELRQVKDEKFMNLKQGSMIVKEYPLKIY